MAVYIERFMKCPLSVRACLPVCLPACLPGWLAGWLAGSQSLYAYRHVKYACSVQHFLCEEGTVGSHFHLIGMRPLALAKPLLLQFLFFMLQASSHHEATGMNFFVHGNEVNDRTWPCVYIHSGIRAIENAHTHILL